MPPAKFRAARPTEDLERIARFYVGAIGLEDRGSFHGHAGYDGRLFATADGSWELEFTYRAGTPSGPPPSPDHLLVFYFDDRAEIAAITARLAAQGVSPVLPANPYWLDRGPTFEDPDGWRIVLCGPPAKRD